MRRDNCLSRGQSKSTARTPRWRLRCRNRCRRTRTCRDSTSQEDEHMLDSSGRPQTPKPLVGREAGVRPDHPRRKDMGAQVRRVAKKGVGAVIDFVGSTSTLTASYEMLRAGGRLVVVGAAGGHLKMNSGSTNGREVHGSISGSLSEMRELVELARQKQFKVVVKAYPLEQVNEVLKMLEEGHIEGRAVLKP